MDETLLFFNASLSKAGSALGILSDDEEACYQQYLLRHPEERAHAQALTSVVRELRGDVPGVLASAETRRNLLDRITATPQA